MRNRKYQRRFQARRVTANRSRRRSDVVKLSNDGTVAVEVSPEVEREQAEQREREQ
jgi:hypothetical protein